MRAPAGNQLTSPEIRRAHHETAPHRGCGSCIGRIATPAQARTDDFTTTGGQNRWYSFSDSSPDVARPTRRGTAHRYTAAGRYTPAPSPCRHAPPRAPRDAFSLCPDGARERPSTAFLRSGPGTSRACLTRPARALLARIEGQFGPVQVISTCRPGARIAGTGRISRHASGNAVDFSAGGRKGAVVRWLIANHHTGGTMTYARMSHIHVDIGQRFVSLNAGARYR